MKSSKFNDLNELNRCGPVKSLCFNVEKTTGDDKTW